MTPSSTNPHHQAETEFTGELQEFFGPALSPDDPSLERRVRKGLPLDTNAAPEEKKDEQEID